MADLAGYYFRLRENGATVFRVGTENRHRRIEMDHIANVNIRNGEVNAKKDVELSKADIDAIEAWMHKRREVIARRDADILPKVIETLNQSTHWVLTKAEMEQIEEHADELMMALHDIRQAIVKKMADSLD